MHDLMTRKLVHGGDMPRSIGVTSQLSGEGVSFTSLALAAALARMRHTCLVEANWWGTGVRLPEPNPGLAGLLQRAAGFGDVAVATNHSGLSIIPAGELAAPDRDLVAAAGLLPSLLTAMQHRFDHVIVDLPAITTSSNALTFARAVDSALLVVRQGATRADQVERALDDLRHTDLLGIVLNASHLSMPGFLQRRLLEV
jgi:Mrp family chromosome partitioning ATPase